MGDTVITMNTATDSDPRLREAALRRDAAALYEDLRSGSFDLRRCAFVSYLIEAGSDRGAAYAAHRQASADGWQATLFVDRSGWVVRLTRIGRVRPQLLARDYRYTDRLAHEHGCVVRGVAIEEVRTDSLWDALASQQRAANAVAETARRVAQPQRRRTRPDHEVRRSLSRSA